MADLLDCVNVAAVAVMASVLAKMGILALSDWRSAVIALLALTAIFVFRKLNSAWVVLSGALAGYLLRML